MANTNTTITESMLQDEVLPALKLGLLPLNAFSLKTVATPVSVGDSVTVPIVSAKTAGAYSSTFESGDTTTTGTAVTMTAPRFSSWYINPNLEAGSTTERFLAMGREAAYAVAKDVLQLALAPIVEANVGATAADESVITAANYDLDDQADMWAKLAAKGVASNYSVIHNIAYAAALMKDAGLQDASAYGSNQLMSTGSLPNIFGAQQFYTDAFPSAVTSQNTTVIFTGKETVAIALGVPADINGIDSVAGERRMLVTDPDTGLQFVWREWKNTATGAYWGSVYVMSGVSFLRDAAVRIVSA